MANHAAAEKSIRKIKRVTAQKRTQRSSMRTVCRKAREALVGQDKEAAQVSFNGLQSSLMRAARKNLIHKNKMMRLVSRAAKRLKAL